MAVIGTLPNNIQNGQLEDATAVMANFNFIVNQVNANANADGTLTAPAGTVMPFAQAAAPLGWVASTDAAHTDAMMRCNVPASYTATSGANAIGLLMAGGASTDGHSLSIGELASHTHTDSGHNHTINDPAHNHPGLGGNAFIMSNAGGAIASGGGSLSTAANTGNATTGISNSPSTANLQTTGSGTAHVHTLTNFNYKMVDYILCTKS